jgi:hypothetical protein
MLLWRAARLERPRRQRCVRLVEPVSVCEDQPVERRRFADPAVAT